MPCNQLMKDLSCPRCLSACLLLNLQPSFMCGFRAALFQNLGSWHRFPSDQSPQFLTAHCWKTCSTIPIKCEMFVEFLNLPTSSQTCAFSETSTCLRYFRYGHCVLLHLLPRKATKKLNAINGINAARPRGSRRSWDFLAGPSAPSAAVVT